MIKFAYDSEDEEKRITIKEIPIMVNEHNELVCIPRSPDMPVIGVVGQRSSGKSFFTHALIDRIYWYTHEPIISLNDLTHEAYYWSKANNIKSQVELLKKYGEIPRPLPIVYFFPHFRGIKLPEHEHFEISIPFKDFILNAPYFLNLKKSYSYLELNLKHIIHCKTPEEILTVLKERIQNSQIINAIMASLHKFIKEEVTDLNSDALSQIDVSDYNYENLAEYEAMEEDRLKNKYPNRQYGPIPLTEEQKEYIAQALEEENRSISQFEHFNFSTDKQYYWLSRSRYHPIIGVARQNLVPVLNTEQLLSKQYFHPYMYYILEKIIQNQSRDSYFESNHIPIWVHIEEITRVASTSLKEKTSQKLIEIAQTGRPLRLGLIYVTQDYNKIDFTLRSQCTYLFAFKLAQKKQANQIAEDRNLAEYEKELLTALKKHEVLAMTSDKFIIYRLDGTKYSTEKTQRGTSLVPLSLHKSPGR